MAKSAEFYEKAKDLYINSWPKCTIAVLWRRLKDEGLKISKTVLYKWREKGDWDKEAANNYAWKLSVKEKINSLEEEMLDVAEKELKKLKKIKDSPGMTSAQILDMISKLSKTVTNIRNSLSKERQAIMQETRQITEEQKEMVVKAVLDTLSQIPEVAKVCKKHSETVKKKLATMTFKEN